MFDARTLNDIRLIANHNPKNPRDFTLAAQAMKRLMQASTKQERAQVLRLITPGHRGGLGTAQPLWVYGVAGHLMARCHAAALMPGETRGAWVATTVKARLQIAQQRAQGKVRG